MSLFGFTLGVAAFGAACLVGAAIFRGLSNREKRRQSELQDNYNAYRRSSNSRYRDIDSSYANQAESMREKSLQEMEAKRALAIAETQARNRPYYEKQMQLCEEQMADIIAGRDQCAAIIKEMKGQSHQQAGQMTSLRYNSLKQARQNFEEAKAYYNAFLGYLQKWKHNQEHSFQQSGELIEVFEVQLPASVPYPGKLLYCRYEDLQQGTFALTVQSGLSYTVRCDDIESITDDEAKACVPVLVTGTCKEHSKRGNIYTSYVLSSSKGRLFALLREQPDIALEVKVERYEMGRDTRRPQTIVSWRGVEMRYKPHRGQRFRRKLPRGAKLRVYVTSFFNTMNMVWASDVWEGNFSPDIFHDIPLFFEIQGFEMFAEAVRKQHLEQSTDDWQIGPCEQDLAEGFQVKCQLGSRFVFTAHWQRLPFGSQLGNRYALVFERMLDETQAFTLEDTYVLIDADFHAQLLVDLVEQDEKAALWGKGSDNLYIYLFHEFIQQERIKASNAEAVYFNHWTRMVSELCQEKEKGSKSTRCIFDVDLPDNAPEWLIHLSVSATDVARYRQNCERWISKREQKKSGYSRRKPHYFAIVPGNSGKERRLEITFNEDDSCLYFLRDKISQEELQSCDGKLTVCLRDYPYPDWQQLSALESFRLSDMANPELKQLIFNLPEEPFSYNGRQMTKLWNGQLWSNYRQMQAVARAVAAEGIFFIQGPPGTGKTTVIREIIAQELFANPVAHILVVSQSNVAVDNVLRGFLHDSAMEPLMVRCGNQDSIAEDLRNYDFFKRLQEYEVAVMQDLLGELQRYRALWREMLTDKDEEILINEYLLADYQIIGATCVGLANQRFGLARSRLDLVVVDEAGKAMPGELLLPINRACRAIIIGDHKQLPPVVDPLLCSQDVTLQAVDILSREEREQFLEQSIFQRLYERAHESRKIMLDMQFRMPETIGTFVSQHFYDSALNNADICKDGKPPLFLQHNLVLLDVQGDAACHEEKTPDGKGLINQREAVLVGMLVQRVRRFYAGRIVIITPYKRQKGIIREEMNKLQEDRNMTRVDTVDSFQGDEAAVVIYSMTRTRYCTGFFSDYARINVAMSRTNNMLFLVASVHYLQQYHTNRQEHVLPALVNYIKERGLLVPSGKLFDDSFDWIWNPVALDSEIGIQVNEIKEYVSISPQEFHMLLPEMDHEQESETSEDQPFVECRKCGALHPAANLVEGFCELCLYYNGRHVQCHACGKEWLFTNYQHYILHETYPKYCDACVELEIHYPCEHCGKDIHITPRMHRGLQEAGKPLLRLCRACSQEIIERRICKECGQTFGITHQQKLLAEEKTAKGVEWSLPVRCPNCREKRRNQS